jgi:hypothetical protein
VRKERRKERERGRKDELALATYNANHASTLRKRHKNASDRSIMTLSLSLSSGQAIGEELWRKRGSSDTADRQADM